MKKAKSITLMFLLSAFTALAFMLTACNADDGGGDTQPESTVSAIELITSNAKTVFDKDEAFSAAGLKVSATMSDDSVKTVFAEDCEITAPDMTSRGIKSVAVKYGGAESGYDITVREIESISVDTSAATTEFLPNAEFTYSGVTVTAKYYDVEGTENVTDFEISTPDLSTVGEKTVTVSYKGKTAQYKVNVHVETSYSIASVELVPDDRAEKIYAVLHGVYSGFTRDEFIAKALTADLQHNGAGNNWDYTDVEPVTEVGDGTFDMTLDITGLSPFGYILHFDKGANGDSLNLTVAGQTQTVEFGGKRYTLSFQNQTDFYGSAGITISYIGQEDIEVVLSEAALSESDGKIYVKIAGTIENYVGDRSDIRLDIQRLTTENRLNVVTTLEMTDDGEFTISGNLSDSGMSTSGDWMIHLFVLGTEYDVRDIATDADSTVTVNGIIWTAKSEAYFDGNPMKFVVVRARSESGEEFTCKLTGMALAEHDGKAYIEFTGTYTGAPLDSDFTSIYFDCENTPPAYDDDNTKWGPRAKPAIEVVSVNDGSFTLRACLDELVPYAYALHFGGIGGEQVGDIKDIAKFEQTLTVNNRVYTLMSDNGHCDDGSHYWGGSGLRVDPAE